ncbi:MAG: HAMP domain-containing histidine kinase [Armatimonadetes bacterium]|nr:HAMP domain-containing histidine kinase [Armatimonadota bacterium]
MERRKGSKAKTQKDFSSMLPQILRAGQGEVIINLLPSAIHELNNALNTLLGFAELLQSKPNIPKSLREDLEAIERAGAKVRELMGTLRFLASGVTSPIQIAPVDLREICQQVVALMNASFRRNYVRLVTEYSDQTPVILSDPSRICFILLALMQNACDAIGSLEESGQLLLKTERDESGCAVLVLENEGQGLPKEVRSKLFEPFVTTKTEGKGAGLGLFLVRHFVEQLQGKIEICDTEKGTRVVVILPSFQPQT